MIEGVASVRLVALSVSLLIGGPRRCACFFFSSRRRHTRFDCDWSSDVCSSDLALVTALVAGSDAASSLAGNGALGVACVLGCAAGWVLGGALIWRHLSRRRT